VVKGRPGEEFSLRLENGTDNPAFGIIRGGLKKKQNEPHFGESLRGPPSRSGGEKSREPVKRKGNPLWGKPGELGC